MPNRPGAVLIAAVVLAAGLATPAAGGPQIPGLPKSKELTEVMKRANQLRDLQVTEAEELKLGADVSARVRDRYGVVQDAAVHRYVTLVGTLLVKKSTRPNLPFRFIVLDTDGVNAFAAPGGYIHITRGALGLMATEAELAGVLAHEISHVTEKHTIKAIQKNKLVQITAEESITKNPEVWNKLVDVTSDLVMAGFGRGEEMESDRDGLAMAEAAGYAPGGLGGVPHAARGPQHEHVREAGPVRLAPRDEGAPGDARQGNQGEEVRVHRDPRRSLQGQHLVYRQAGDRDRHDRGGLRRAGRQHGEAGRGAQEEGLQPRRAHQAGRPARRSRPR